MEKKVLIVATILVAVLFGLMFQEVWQAERVPDVTQSAIRPVPVTHAKPALDTLDGLEEGSSSKTTDNHQSDTDSSDATETKTVAKTDESTPVIVEKAPPVFGMMQSSKTTQIVGLLSSTDQNGTLGRFLNRFCQTHRCKSDLDYQNSIESAPWQKDVVSLVRLIAEGKLADGSLFIENNTIKIEGNATNADAVVQLQTLFASLERHGLKLLPSPKLAQSLKTKRTPKTETKQADLPVKEDAQSTVTAAHTETEKLKKTDHEKTAHPLHTPVQSVAKKRHSKPSDAVSDKKVSHPNTKKSIAKKRKVQKRKVHQVKRKPKAAHDIIAPSYMETAYDLQKKIEAKRAHTYEAQTGEEEVVFEEDKKPDEMIAKPKFEILQ